MPRIAKEINAKRGTPKVCTEKSDDSKAGTPSSATLQSKGHTKDTSINTRARSDAVSKKVTTFQATRQERKLVNVAKLNIGKSSIIGTDDLKATVWNTTLQKAIYIVKKAEEMNDDAKKRAIDNLKCLESNEEATEAGSIHLKNYDYFTGDRVRTVISVAFEDSIPGDWSCGWSSDRVRKISMILSVLFGNLMRTEAKILRGMPIFVVSAILDVLFTADNRLSVGMWAKGNFRSNVICHTQSCIESTLTKHDVSGIDVSVFTKTMDLIELLCKNICPLFRGRDMKESADVLQSVQLSLSQGKVTGVEWKTQEVEHAMNLLSDLSASLYHELIPQVWDKYSEKKPHSFTMESLMFETLYLPRDVYEPIWIWQNAYWNTHLQDLMFEMGEKDDMGFYDLNFKRVFLLLNVLQGEGLGEVRVDTHVVAEQLVGRLNIEGHFTKKRIREHIPQRYKRRLATERLSKQKAASKGPKKVGRLAAV